MATDEAIVLVWSVNNLHRELASLYYTHSRDVKRIDILWNEIERQEDLLRIADVEGPWS